MNSKNILLFFIVGCFIVSCGNQQVSEPDAPAPEAYNKPEVTPTIKPVAQANITFTDISNESGVTFVHNNGYTGNKYMPETMGGGCGFFDYDNDGDLDLLFVNGRNLAESKNPLTTPSTPELYQNDGSGKFTNITAQAGLSNLEIYGMGCSMADYDGDGDNDIFFTSAIDGQRMYRNDNGTYTDVTEQTGLNPLTWTNDEGKSFLFWSTSSVFFDYNNDGWLDLFVCNYIQWSVESDIHTSLTGIGKAFTKPDLYKGLSPLLYKNNGDGTFSDVSKESGVWNPDSKALGVSVEDLNGDGFMDVVVANDAQPDFLYQNNNGESFTDIGLSAGIAYGEDGRARAGMGIDIAYPLNQEKPAIAVGNFSGEPVSFFVQESEDFFVDASGKTRISRPSMLSLTFGLAYLDYDYDGWLDFAIANGHIEPDIEQVEKEVKYKQPTQMFRNINGQTYEDITSELGDDFSAPIAGRGLAYGDIDQDGDLDIVVTNLGASPRILQNNGGANANNWVRFQCKGNAPNTNAIGTRIMIEADGKKQYRRVRTGSSYCSQSELTLSFGLGQSEKIDAITVTWYDGTTKIFTQDELQSIKINQTNQISL